MKCSEFSEKTFFIDIADKVQRKEASSDIKRFGGTVVKDVKSSNVVITTTIYYKNYPGKRLMTRHCVKQLATVSDHDCTFTHLPISNCDITNANIAGSSFVPALEGDVLEYVSDIITACNGSISKFDSPNFFNCCWVKEGEEASGSNALIDLALQNGASLLNVQEFLQLVVGCDTSRDNSNICADSPFIQTCHVYKETPPSLPKIIDNYNIRRSRVFHSVKALRNVIALSIGLHVGTPKGNFTFTYPLQKPSDVKLVVKSDGGAPEGFCNFELVDDGRYEIRGYFNDKDKTQKYIIDKLGSAISGLLPSAVLTFTSSQSSSKIILGKIKLATVFATGNISFVVHSELIELLNSETILNSALCPHAILSNEDCQALVSELDVEWTVLTTSKKIVYDSGFPLVLLPGYEDKIVIWQRISGTFFSPSEGVSLSQAVGSLLQESNQKLVSRLNNL